MVRVTIAMIFLGQILVTNLAAQEGGAAQAIPSTISPEAQEFLRNPPPPLPSPSTPEDWVALRKSIEEREQPRSKEVAKALAEKVEVRVMNGVTVHVITPKRLRKADADKALIHIHGGGYCLYSSESTYFITATMADWTGLRVYCIDYRLAPEYPYPAGLDDCIKAYQAIIQEVEPKKIGMFGISAGGSMILAMVLRAEKEGLAMPGAIAGISPRSVDFTTQGDSGITLNGKDPVLTADAVSTYGRAYAGDVGLGHPLISPVYAKYSMTFPPTIIQTGTRDIFLSGCARLYRVMKDGGVEVELSVWEGMWHGFHIFPSTTYPEAKTAFRELAQFFNKRLGMNRDDRQ